MPIQIDCVYCVKEPGLGEWSESVCTACKDGIMTVYTEAEVQEIRKAEGEACVDECRKIIELIAPAIPFNVVNMGINHAVNDIIYAIRERSKGNEPS